MIALDTNILIYACDRADSRRQQRAIELVSTATDAVLLWQVACEFVAASRKLDAQGFTPKDAWARLSEYLGALPACVAHANNFRACKIHAYDGSMVLLGCDDRRRLLRMRVTTLYSEDLPGRIPPCGLEVLNPFK